MESFCSTEWAMPRGDARPCVSTAHCGDAGRRLIWITPCKRSAVRGTASSSFENCVAVQPATGLRGGERLYPELRLRLARDYPNRTPSGVIAMQRSGRMQYAPTDGTTSGIDRRDARPCVSPNHTNHINQINHSSDNKQLQSRNKKNEKENFLDCPRGNVVHGETQ
jgi:hypothetical protein